MAYLRHIWSWLRDWLPYILPAISNLILVLLGIIMSLPALAEKVEQTPRHRKWLATTCLIFGLIGFIFDVSQRRSSDATNKTLLENVGTALQNTDDLVKQTTNLVTTASITVPKLNELDGKIANLKIQIAKNQNDPKVLANLQHQAKQLQDQRDDLSRELMTMTLAPQIAKQLRDWEGDWKADQHDNHLKGWEESFQYRNEHPNDSQGQNAIDERWQRVYDKTDHDYEKKLGQIIASAELVRKDLLERIPGEQVDITEQAKFAEALRDSGSLNRVEAADYLDSLVLRVPLPIHPPEGLKSEEHVQVQTRAH